MGDARPDRITPATAEALVSYAESGYAWEVTSQGYPAPSTATSVYPVSHELFHLIQFAGSSVADAFEGYAASRPRS